jgi:hypothetical protein
MVVNLGFLDRGRYFFLQVAPRLSSRGFADPVPDLLLLRKSGTDTEFSGISAIILHEMEEPWDNPPFFFQQARW